MHWLKYNKTDQTTHFLLPANFYMWHQGAIFREFINDKGSQFQHMVPKYVGVGT
jgi:hypothetical protein